jgi:pimeloyl-ACP methyl ester carboxylesterase
MAATSKKETVAMKRALIALGAAALAYSSPVFAQSGDKPISVVLVHGAWVDGSGWKAVHDALEQDGHEVLVVQNPTVTLEADVAVTRRAIAQAKHPVVLVGHSYGGTVITEAGNDPKVRSLVYVAAFVPDAGESTKTLSSRPVPPGTAKAPVLPPVEGFITLDKTKMPMSFAGDVDPKLTRFMADSQVPWGVGGIGGKITKPAWKSKPAYYLMTTEDKVVPPMLQRFMAERAKAKIVEQPSSHAVMLSHPDTVIRVIESAAGER